MLRYDFQTLGIGWNVRLDAFNVFNEHSVLWVQEAAELSSNGVPLEDYGEPGGFQSPRTIRLGFGLSF